MKKTLYVSRNLLNGEEFHKWAVSQGFKNILDPKDLHVTIAFSRAMVDWSKLKPKWPSIKIANGKRTVMTLGDEGGIVLKFESNALKDRWQYYKDQGCSWDYDSYLSHVSITYKGEGMDLRNVEPYKGELLFGNEILKELDLNWKEDK